MRFDLKPMKLVAPIKLEEQFKHTTRQLRANEAGPSLSGDVLGHAKRLVEVYREQRKLAVPDRRAVSGLMQLVVANPSDPVIQTAAVALILNKPDLSARQLFTLWKVAEVERERITRRLKRALQESRRAQKWLPDWVVPNPSEALERPGTAIRAYFERSSAEITEFDDRTGLSSSFGAGFHAALELVRMSPAAWWQASRSTGILEWAADRRMELQCAVATRALEAAGGSSQRAAELRLRPEINELRRWCVRILDVPERAPGTWKHISRRAREVFEWLFIADAIEKAFEEFRRHAEDQRSSFWEGYRQQIDDARYVLLKGGTSLVLLRFSDVLVAEFGTTGHACQIFEVPQEFPALREVFPGERTAMSAADFRPSSTRSSISLANQRLMRIFRQPHHTGWQPKLRSKLSGRLGWRRH